MSSISSKIGKRGRIKNGKYEGHTIRIDDDSAKSGGYVIRSWPDDTSPGFDDWVESMEALEQFFKESGWDIEWLE